MTLSASSAGSAASATPGGVRLRESKPRKPRPMSVPSFVNVDATSSPRSKSTDRLARERSRPRTSSARRMEERDKEKAKDQENNQEKDKGQDETKRQSARMSRSTLDRLSAPKQPSKLTDDKDSGGASTPRRESPVTRKQSTKERTPKDGSKTQPSPKPPTSSVSAPAAVKSGSATPNKSRDHSPATSATHTPSRTPVRIMSPTPAGADEDGGSGTHTTAMSVTNSEPTPTITITPVMEKSGTDKSMEKSITEKSAEKSSAMEKSTGDITAEEYKAKLAEKRRQAREKAEKEAEEERKRHEEEERLEEERRQQEEEEERRQMEEAMKIAEEGRKAEEERLQKAIEAEEARKAEEAARLEQERLAKEETDKKAKEEAERLELEKLEKSRREEEERQERKKRLEMIMKRVKTDSTGDSPKDLSKSLTGSPTKSVTSTASSDASPMEPENKTVAAMAVETVDAAPVNEAPDEKTSENGTLSPVTAASPVPEQVEESSHTEDTEEVGSKEQEAAHSESPVESGHSTPRAVTPENNGSAVTITTTGSDKPKFKSPLLQKLVEGKDDAGSSSSPRFKSPLLQNILGKTKVGARMGFSQDHSISTPDLSKYEQPSNQDGDGPRVSPLRDTGLMSSSMYNMGVPGDGKAANASHKESINRRNEKDVDTSEGSSPSSHHSSPGHTAKTLVSNGEEGDPSIRAFMASQLAEATPMDISGTMESSTSGGAAWSEQHSGVDGSTALPASLQFSYNGHGLATSAQGGLGDSSISMRSVESSVTSSITESVSSLPPHGTGHGGGDNEDFEELIDLAVYNKTASTAATTLTFLDNSDDLMNCNTVEGLGEGPGEVPPASPIIAFEETSSAHRQDVPDLLS